MHYDKHAEPAENFEIDGRVLKWYKLAKASEPVPDHVYDLARNFLVSETAATQSLGKDGFVILHRCGEDFYFLLVSTWKNGNELWESVYAKRSDADADFSEFPLDGPHRGTYCVWELAIVWHEQQAWKRFLRSDGGSDSSDGYLLDKYSGVT